MPSLIERWRSWRDDTRRTRKAGELQRRGDEIYAAGQTREAIEVLQEAIALVGTSDMPDPSKYGVKGSVLLLAEMTLAQAADKTGDRALALESIRIARALLALLRRNEHWNPDEKIVRWEDWAKSYTEEPA